MDQFDKYYPMVKPKATGLTLLMAKTFGKKITVHTGDCIVRAYKFRGTLYIHDIIYKEKQA